MKNFLIILFTLSTLAYTSSANTRTARATPDFSSFKPRQTSYIKQNRFVIPLNQPYPFSISYVEHSLPVSRTINVADTPAAQYPTAQALLMPDSEPQYLSIPIPLGAKSSVMYWPQQPAVRAYETRNEQVPQYPATHEKVNKIFEKDQYEAVPSYVQEVEAPSEQNPLLSEEEQHYWSAQYVQPHYVPQQTNTPPQVTQQYYQKSEVETPKPLEHSNPTETSFTSYVPQQTNTPPQNTHQYYQKPEVVTPKPVVRSNPTETSFTPPNTYQLVQNQPYYISIPKPLAYRNYY